MSKAADGYLYTESHEWVKPLDDKTVLVGITDYAQAQLGTVVFVDLPEAGKQLKMHEELGAVESVKAASDIYSPVSGKVLEVNEDLVGEPEKINNDPYEAWLVKVELDDKSELQKLLSKADYEKISK
ncbi:MAG TPA: glycine cleavage system protein GcvH [Bacillota bacterium]|nr:glycine cleavage system protein GcvH [Bacillota bacterium]HPF42988.1 glycine cleavage system protein GcvH [Bacillota bacterium]HPJ85477.1 glycine cleavage system protein GcvH [Bacillota bacterium]HPQ61901.1 glycine cleavage system protein GcvH [Bacillota bacterium]HRX91802.1 glycine cleavage system protein GcvH [Candidatus Izemoplasmatales bacterium]